MTDNSWIGFWNSQHSIYVNARHLDRHYRDVAEHVLMLRPSSTARVLDFGCGEAIHADRVAVSAYVICGGLTALSAILIAMYTRSISPAVHGSFYELYAIAAAVLGGCSLRGGEGSIIGVVLGTVLLQVLQNLVNLLGITHVERNGHHYVDGMAALPAAEQAAFLDAHPDVYERSHGAVRLKIRGGRIDVGSLGGVGFASGAMPDFGAMAAF